MPTPSLSSPADPSAALPADCIVAPSTEGNGRCAPQQAVGAVLRDPTRQAEDELDDAIDTLRTMAALAQDRGDIETAFEYTRRMLAASRSRTTAHQDRLAREHLAMVERSLDQGAGYFAAEGDRARTELKSQGGAVA